MKPDQERVKNLLADTVTLLCKNGLNFRKELRVQGLIGITLDNDDVFIVHINERLSSNDDVATVHDNDKENSAESTNLGTSGEKKGVRAQNSTAERNDTVMRDSIMFSPVHDSGMDHSDLAVDNDTACAIVKIEKVENIPLGEQPVSYDKMVDFASFLPDFSSARYPHDLTSLQHGNLPIPGLPAAAEVPRYPKRKHNSGLALDNLQFLPKTSEGECSDGGLLNDPSGQDSMPVMSFHGGQSSDVRRLSASLLAKNSDMLLEQKGIDVASGLNDEYSRAMASSYFGVGVDCSGQSSQGFESQQCAPFQWKRRSQHSREKPFSCTVPGCGRTYWNQAHLSRHRVKYHGIYKRLFRKPAHETLASMNYRWKRRSQHSLEKPFHCTVTGCSRSYWNMPDLYRHRKMNHGICGRAHARKKAEQDLLSGRPTQ